MSGSKSGTCTGTKQSSRRSRLPKEAESAILTAAARKAELLCRARALKQKLALEKQEFELKQQREQLEIDTDLQAEEAKIEMLERFEESSRGSGSLLDFLPQANRKHAVKEWLESNHEEDDNGQGQYDQALNMAEQNKKVTTQENSEELRPKKVTTQGNSKELRPKKVITQENSEELRPKKVTTKLNHNRTYESSESSYSQDPIDSAMSRQDQGSNPWASPTPHISTEVCAKVHEGSYDSANNRHPHYSNSDGALYNQNESELKLDDHQNQHSSSYHRSDSAPYNRNDGERDEHQNQHSSNYPRSDSAPYNCNDGERNQHQNQYSYGKGESSRCDPGKNNAIPDVYQLVHQQGDRRDSAPYKRCNDGDRDEHQNQYSYSGGENSRCDPGKKNTISDVYQLVHQQGDRNDNRRNDGEHDEHQNQYSYNKGESSRCDPGKKNTIPDVYQLMHQQGDLTRLLLEAQIKSTLPQRNIPVFNGDSLEYVSWLSAFEYGVEMKTSNNGDRLYFLHQYTSGPAKALVSSCMHLPPDIAYFEAKSLIKKKYGNKYRIAEGIMKKVQSWPEIKANDSTALENMSLFLRECANTMAALSIPNELDHAPNIRALVTKLPYGMRDKWRILADNIEEIQSRNVKFQDLVQFVDRQSRIASNPAYGNIQDDKHPKNNGSRARQATRNRATTYSTTAQPSGGTTHKEEKKSTVKKTGGGKKPSDEWKKAEDTKGRNDREKPSVKKWCLNCENDAHTLDLCQVLQKRGYEDRIAFMRKNGLCFGCVKKGSHLVRDCKNRLTCKNCKGRHPTVLHRDKKQENNDTADKSTTCGFTGAGVTSVVSVVPVRVRSTETGKEISTYALLDTKSTAVFCTKGLKNKLALHGNKSRIKIQTINGVENVDTQKLTNLEVSDINGNNLIQLPDVYVRDTIPVNREDIISKEDLKPFTYLQEVSVPETTDGDQVEILIGNNVPRAIEPIQVIQSQGDGPYACKSLLGWEIHGLTKHTDSITELVHRVIAKEDLHSKFVEMYNHDFNECTLDETPQNSREDDHFIRMVKDSIQLKDGHYEIGLPLRNAQVKMPNNRSQAEQRAAHLKRKFKKNQEFYKDYADFMTDMTRNGYAERVPSEDSSLDGHKWYLPHHGVYHPQKQKLRIVFDCAAKYRGTSLNDQLLQGPDLTNTLVGVLTRFRQGAIALIADIKSMFYQVGIPQTSRDLMRFLWWPDGDLEQTLQECRMTVHSFGATSSPSCANYALRQTAVDNQDQISGDVIDTINHNFYVDDCLRSVESEERALSLVENLTSTLQKGGFRLTKFVSNSRKIIEALPEEDRAKGLRSLSFQDSLPVERVLGVLWSPEKDMFGFKIEIKNHPLTRRGLLSTVSSVYDPLGFASPVILPARQILQELCRQKLGWDDDIGPEQQKRWLEWTDDLHKIEEFHINRCLKPRGFEHPSRVQIHHFADASGVGYGTASYIRLINSNGEVHCQLLIAKSRVAPLKKITIPRMELTAATVAVKVDHMLHKELQIPVDESIFWTDSTTVLSYIKNESARYHTFVANRVQQIREGSSPSQWRHVETTQNPADECSRGQSVQKFLENQRWTRGPSFLWQNESEWPSQTTPSDRDQLENDPEVKTVNAIRVEEQEDPIEKLLQHYSEWCNLKKAVAYILRLKRMLLKKVKENDKETQPRQESKQAPPLSVEDLNEAEEAIVCYIQQKAYAKEISALKSSDQVKGKKIVERSSTLYRLDAFLDRGVLKVGGRLGLADIPPEAKHPIILPKNTIVSELILRNIHQSYGHSGRNQMLAELQQKFWIVGANSMARKIINRCIVCRRQRSKLMQQKMANLPTDRITPSEPLFTRVGVDYFGPLEVKQGRSMVKRYGVVFVCLASKAIHLEKADSLTTDACINVFRRFIARRGQVTQIRSDNGTNLVGAEKEMRKEIDSWNQAKIHQSLLQKNVNWVFNPPGGSHFGGIWERQIRTIRRIMYAMVKEQILTDDSLQTVLCEIESIVNSRPITKIPCEPNDPEPLTPNQLLLMKSNTNLPPAATEKPNQYAKKRWKQVQYLADLFWRRWTREYLPQLQARQKWLQPKRNAEIGDLVLIVNEATSRNQWPLGKVIEIMPDREGWVRQVRVKTKSNTLVRPVDKLCLLLEAESAEPDDS